MIAKLIRWSIANRFLVLLATLMVAGWGVWAMLRTPLDAIPDLSDVQVIIRTTYPGPGAADRREPGHLSAHDHDDVGAGREDRARLLVVRRFLRLHPVRGRHRSLLGALARARVPEPGAVAPAGAGESLARDRMPPASAGSTNTRSSTAAARTICAQLRALQDWFLKYELKTVPNVSEVASVGGMVRQYQIVLDPGADAGVQHYAGARHRRRAARRTRSRAARCSSWAKPSTWCARPAICRSLDDFRRIPLTTSAAGVAGAAGRRRARADRPRNAPRHRRTERRRRSGRRHHRHALGQERARDHRRREGEARANCKSSLPRRRRDRPDLRPLGSHQARGRQPAAASSSRSSSSSRSCASCFCSTCARRSSRSSRCRSAC